MRIQRRAQFGNQRRQRIFEIAVFALAESVPCHVDMAAEMFFARVKRGDVVALVRRQQFWQDSAAETVEIVADRAPIVRVDAPVDGYFVSGFQGGAGFSRHGTTSDLHFEERLASFHGASPPEICRSWNLSRQQTGLCYRQ